jgi:hypothetical protein
MLVAEAYAGKRQLLRAVWRVVGGERRPVESTHVGRSKHYLERTTLIRGQRGWAVVGLGERPVRR